MIFSKVQNLTSHLAHIFCVGATVGDHNNSHHSRIASSGVKQESMRSLQPTNEGRKESHHPSIMLVVVFTVVYYVTGTISLLTGAMGMLFPFWPLGDFTPFYSDELAVGINNDDGITELLTVHLARMCQSLVFGMGLLFFLLPRYAEPSQRVRVILLFVNSIVTLWYSLVGEIYLDVPRAQRLLGTSVVNEWSSQRQQQQHEEEYSRSIRFLMGALADGGSLVAVWISLVGLIVATVAAITSSDADDTTPKEKKKEN